MVGILVTGTVFELVVLVSSVVRGSMLHLDGSDMEHRFLWTGIAAGGESGSDKNPEVEASLVFGL